MKAVSDSQCVCEGGTQYYYSELQKEAGESVKLLKTDWWVATTMDDDTNRIRSHNVLSTTPIYYSVNNA